MAKEAKEFKESKEFEEIAAKGTPNPKGKIGRAKNSARQGRGYLFRLVRAGFEPLDARPIDTECQGCH
jgi:hypothetical protein